jgi:hypothetical protein
MTYPALEDAVFHCIKSGIRFPDEFYDWMAAKTEGYYNRVLDNLVKKLYNGTMDETEYVMTFSDLVSGQMRRAWNEGMRAVGLDPAKDMTDAMQSQLDDIIRSEREYILGFADAIESARANGDPIQPLLDRADLWTDQYNTTEGMAEIFCAADDSNFAWHYGGTSEHCEDCAAMVAVGVQSAVFWREQQANGIYPGSPDLECHGFNCQCLLESTDEPVDS